MRPILSLVLILACTVPAFGQILFYADIEGSQETPPVASGAGAWGSFRLSGTNLSYEVHSHSIVITGAHVHIGPPGTPGPILFPLAGGSSVFAGLAVLTAADAATLRAEGLYVNLHSAAFPGGEIRGQIEVRPTNFAGAVRGTQEVPANASAATADASFDVNAALGIDYTVPTVGLVGGTNAHIHDAPIGVNGGIVFPLAGGPVLWAGTTAAMTTAQYDTLQGLGYYVNVHSGAFPGGEIRSQLISEGIRYGDIDLTTMTFDITGAPTGLGTISMEISGGLPSGIALVQPALQPGAGIIKQNCFWLNPGTLLGGPIGLPLDGTGSITLPFLLPPALPTVDVYLQAFSPDSAAPGGLRVSNGVKLPIQALP